MATEGPPLHVRVPDYIGPSCNHTPIHASESRKVETRAIAM